MISINIQSFTEWLNEKKLLMKYSSKDISGVFPDKPLLGHGIQAFVYDLEKHPNAVLKAINVKGEHDPVVQFLRVCVNHQDNPFFPKVYSYKMYKRKEITDIEQEYIESNMEKDEFPEQADYILLVITEKLVDIMDTQSSASIIDMLNQLKLLPEPLDDLEEALISVKRAFETTKARIKLRERVTDASLIEVLRLLEPLFKHFIADVHCGNMMLRLPQKQLVIIDPLM